MTESSNAGITVQDIQEQVLQPFQQHRQLSIKESETLTLELLTLLCDAQLGNGLTLRYVARLFTPEAYDDLVEERNINDLCGYPLCSHAPERNVNKNQSLHHGNAGVMASDKNDAIIRKFLWENNPYAYLSKFCSKFHFRCSQFYQVQLSDEALFARTGIHLINDTLKDSNSYEEEYNVTLFEELLREKSSDDNIKSLVVGLKKLGLHGTEEGEDGEDKILEDELSKWLSEIKIVENEDPPFLGDLVKED